MLLFIIFEHYGLYFNVEAKIENKYPLNGEMSNGGYCYLIVQCKNEMASTNATEPLYQAISYYLESTRTTAIEHAESVLPCLLLILCG